MAFSPPLTL
jgi:ribosomal protein S26